MGRLAMKTPAPGVNAAAVQVPQTVIIGSRGRMGRMFLSRARACGINASGVDLPLAENDLASACATARMALVCVPARHFASTLARIVPFLPKDAILADITSVKETPMRQMEQAWSGDVVGTHPLFGPGNKVGDDLPVVLVRGSNTGSAAMDMVSVIFKTLGCRVFESSAQTHDQAMARIQNMNFITNLAYFAVLAGQKDLLPFLTPSFERRKNAAAKMLTEDAEMFAGLFDANGHSHEAVRQYRKMLNVAASGDIELLCKRAQWWWSGEACSDAEKEGGEANAR